MVGLMTRVRMMINIILMRKRIFKTLIFQIITGFIRKKKVIITLFIAKMERNIEF